MGRGDILQLNSSDLVALQDARSRLRLRHIHILLRVQPCCIGFGVSSLSIKSELSKTCTEHLGTIFHLGLSCCEHRKFLLKAYHLDNQKSLFGRCLFCLVGETWIIQHVPMQMCITLRKNMQAPYFLLHLCSVGFPVLNLCQQRAKVSSEPIACASSLLALWGLKLLFQLWILKCYFNVTTVR